MSTVTDSRILSLAFTVLLTLGFFAPQTLTAQSSSMDRHAEVGRLEAVDDRTDRIVTALPLPSDEAVYRSYDTDFDTNVVGLGEVMAVEDIPENAVDNVVVVTFVPGEDRSLAKSLYFPDETEVLESTGIIERIDRDESVLVITSPEGEERFDLGIGPGATIDSNEGLLSASDLQVGQQVSVYHAEPTEISPAAIEEAFVVFVH